MIAFNKSGFYFYKILDGYRYSAGTIPYLALLDIRLLKRYIRSSKLALSRLES